MCLLGASVAVGQTIKLDKTRVIYTTSDTVSVDAGEAIPFSSADLVNGFNAVGMAFEGSDSKYNGLNIAFTKDYVDSETGFTMPKGYYRGVEVQGTYRLYGNVATPSGEISDSRGGFTNIKKVIAYLVPAGYAVQHDNGYNMANWQTLFSGRIQAQYAEVDDTGAVKATTNTAYREIAASNTQYNTEDWNNCINIITDFMNWKLLDDDAFQLGYNTAYISVDQPYKLSVDVTNNVKTSDLEAILKEGKPTEFQNFTINGTTEAEMAYYFADKDDCSSSEDDADAAASSTGYNFYTKKWGKKVDYSTNTGVLVSLKKGFIMVGLALVSATDGAEKEYLDATAGPSASFSSDPDQAYGIKVSEMSDDPWADRRIGNKSGISKITADADADAPFYNLAGQRVTANTKGILIKAGKKIVNK